MIFHENRQQTILMEYHALFVIFEQDKFDEFISPDEGLFERNM